MSDRVGHLSATSIVAYKACPTRYRLGYVEAIRQEIEPQPLRMGTAWHAILEALGMGLSLEEAIEKGTQVYTDIPAWADPTEWAVEREIVANAGAVYHWLYKDQNEYEVVETEKQFELPLVNPETGRPTPSMVRVGKIDRIMRHKPTGTLLIGENKSTSKPIDSGSLYWSRLRKDTQSKFYICAARDLGHEVVGLLHDVFHKPAIKPAKLTMAESAAFVKTGEYCGQKFNLCCARDGEGIFLGVPHPMEVDGVMVEIEPGKKDGTFALRETPGMFGARLFQGMTATPDKYFARREIAFTDDELQGFRYQLWALQRTMNDMERTGHWFENEFSCDSPFRCPYVPICLNNVACCDGVTTPPGFKRLRVEEAETTAVEGE